MARSHSVHVLAHDTQRSQVKDDGAEFEPLHGVFQLNSGDPFPEGLAFALDNVCLARGFGSDLLSAVDRLNPDLLSGT
jgi:hypothetical protein